MSLKRWHAYPYKLSDTFYNWDRKNWRLDVVEARSERQRTTKRKPGNTTIEVKWTQWLSSVIDVFCWSVVCSQLYWLMVFRSFPHFLAFAIDFWLPFTWLAFISSTSCMILLLSPVTLTHWAFLSFSHTHMPCLTFVSLCVCVCVCMCSFVCVLLV